MTRCFFYRMTVIGQPVSLSVALPKTFSFKDFHSTGSTKARRYPLSYIFSGLYNAGTGNLGYQDGTGNWWSSVAVNNSRAHSLGLDNTVLYQNGDSGKIGELPLRCLPLHRLDQSPPVSAFVYILR